MSLAASFPPSDTTSQKLPLEQEVKKNDSEVISFVRSDLLSLFKKNNLHRLSLNDSYNDTFVLASMQCSDGKNMHISFLNGEISKDYPLRSKAVCSELTKNLFACIEREVNKRLPSFSVGTSSSHTGNQKIYVYQDFPKSEK